MKNIIMVKFEGVDSWNRPIFKDDQNRRYGSVDTLFSWDATAEQVLERVIAKDLLFFGGCFDCEPLGVPPQGELVIKK